ncbi:MAG: copper resistance protein NlpE [Moheibacter sp.]
MKKVFLIAAVAGLFIAGCNSTKEESLVNADEQSEEPAIDMSNSKNSIQYLGTYKGVVPCADCEGIETVITLNPDESYEIKETYLGKSDNSFEDIGSFDWMDDGNRLKLEDTDSNIRFFEVAENKLIMLDSEGNPAEGPNDKNYELIKQ